MLKLRLWISLFLVMTLGSAYGSSLSRRSTPVVCEPPIVWHLNGDCLLAGNIVNCTRPTVSSGFDDLPHTRLAVQSTLMTEDGDRNNLWLGPGEVAGGANRLHFCYQGESPIEWEIETQMNVLMNVVGEAFLCLEVIHAVNSIGGLQTPMDQGPTCENTLEMLGVNGTRQSFQSRAIRATTFTNGECYLPTVVELFTTVSPQNIVLTDFTATFTQKGCR